MHDEKQIADGLLAPLGLRLEHESWPADCLVVKMDALAQPIDTNVECVYGDEVVGTSCKSLQSFGTGQDFMEHLKFIAAFVVSKVEMSWMHGAAYDAEPSFRENNCQDNPESIFWLFKPRRDGDQERLARRVRREDEEESHDWS